MKTKDMVSNAFIIDTYKAGDGRFVPGAITYFKKKKLEVMRWDEYTFATQQEADDFVRERFADRQMQEAMSEAELKK